MCLIKSQKREFSAVFTEKLVAYGPIEFHSIPHFVWENVWGKMGHLSASSAKAAKLPGRYSDGDGLYLVISPRGGKSWICRTQKGGKRRDFGLGSFKKVGLALARERAAKVRRLMEAGLDPVAERRKEVGIPSFQEAARAVYSENQATWKNKKHRAQWLTSLQTYAFPIIGDISVADIDIRNVRDTLIPIWLEKPETARRVRQRINSVIDWSVAKGYREQPLSLAAMNKSLPNVRKTGRHQPALPYAEVPVFFNRLRLQASVSHFAFEFLILTAARSGDVRGATWDEIDLEGKLWTVPAFRMKAGREHVVPLSNPAIEVLKQTKKFCEASNSLVFPGRHYGKPLSDMTLSKICRDMKVQAVPHGFRSSFRDWVAEKTDFDGDIAEMALAHAIEDKVEAAYRRGNLLNKRKRLMDTWGAYCVSDV